METLRELLNSEPLRAIELARQANRRAPDSPDAAERAWIVVKALASLNASTRRATRRPRWRRNTRQLLGAGRQTPYARPAAGPAVARGAAATDAAGAGQPAAAMIFGIDTASVAEQEPGLGKAKATGPISFAIIRSNYGTTTDSRLRARVAEAEGGRPGARRVSVPAIPAREQAGALARGAGGGGDRYHRRSRRRRPSAHGRRRVSRQGPREDGPVRAGVPGRCRAPPARGDEGHYGVDPIIYTSARVWRDDLRTPPADDSPAARSGWRATPSSRAPQGADAAVFADGKLDPPVPPPGRRRQLVDSPVPGRRGEVSGIPERQRRHEPLQTAFKGARGARVKWIQRRLGITERGTLDAPTEARGARLPGRQRLLT